MVKNLILGLLLYCLFGSNVLAQTTGFMKSYDIDGTDTNDGRDIIRTSDGYFVRTGPICPSGCIGIMKIDTNGVKQSDNLFTNESGDLLATKGVGNLGDAGFIIAGSVGHPFEGYTAAFFLRISTNGDSLKFGEHGSLGQREGTTSVALIKDSLFCTILYSDIAITYANLKLLKMDTCLSDLTEIPLLGINGYAINSVTYILPSPDSLFLYLSILHRTPYTSDSRYLSIRKIDLQGTTIWTYPLSGYTTSTNTPTQILVLPNGNIVTRWFDEVHYTGSNFFDSNPYLICISSNGQDSVWRYNFNANVYRKSPIMIKLAANGDIIGCGYTDNPNYNYACGWLFRMSPQGQLLWEREYISYTPTVNFLLIEGITEDPDGSIVATGLIIDTLSNGGVEGNALLLKVLPNGCFTPNCNGGAEDTLIVASTVTGIEASPQPPPKEGGIASPLSEGIEGRLVVFPNPADNALQVLLPSSSNRKSASLQIIDLQGRVLHSANLPATATSPFVSLSTANLPNGMYVLTYTVLGVVQNRAKVVVNHQ